MAQDFFERTGQYDWATLRLARDAYGQAGQINHRDTYPLLNVARLDLLLSQGDSAAQVKALEQFRTLEHLARFAASTEGDDDPWKWLDLADTLAVNGKTEEAVDAARNWVGSNQLTKKLQPSPHWLPYKTSSTPVASPKTSCRQCVPSSASTRNQWCDAVAG